MKHDESSEDDGSAFDRLLGVFRSNAAPERRARSERMASMKPTDKRRASGPARVRQYNVRISDKHHELAHLLATQAGLSNAEIVEDGIEFLAKKHGINTNAQ